MATPYALAIWTTVIGLGTIALGLIALGSAILQHRDTNTSIAFAQSSFVADHRAWIGVIGVKIDKFQLAEASQEGALEFVLKNYGSVPAQYAFAFAKFFPINQMQKAIHFASHASESPDRFGHTIFPGETSPSQTLPVVDHSIIDLADKSQVGIIAGHVAYRFAGGNGLTPFIYFFSRTDGGYLIGNTDGPIKAAHLNPMGDGPT